MELKENLVDLRKKKGLSQTELGEVIPATGNDFNFDW